MKAKELKNGTYTISGITKEEIIAMADYMAFAERAEHGYMHNVEEMRKRIDEIRENGTTEKIYMMEFLFRCMANDLRK